MNKHRTRNSGDCDAKVKQRWIREAEKHLLGRTVIGISYLTDQEVGEMCWINSSVVLHFDDGSTLFPSADDEGNNAGALFGNDANGCAFDLCVI